MSNTESPPVESDDAGARRSSLDFPVVGIGGSAGGLRAAIRFFEHMPATSGMAFVLVLHLSPDHASNAAAILQRATSMPVIQVNETLPVEPNRIYVIPPAAELRMDDGKLTVQHRVRPYGQPVAIDIFFRTLAQAHRERAFAVVLSGAGSDGTVGLGAVKAEGGVVLAQHPTDAEFESMPSAAARADLVDFVLPAAEMPQKLLDIWHNARRIRLPDAEAAGIAPSASGDVADAEAADGEHALAEIMRTLALRTDNDFHHYKRATVLRRVERRMQVTQEATLPAYARYLESHPAEARALLQDMLISVTNFFRDRSAFDALERELADALPTGARSPERIRAWSVGCATGEEAYSLAMLLNDLPSTRKAAVQVFASDIDERALEVARAGIYPDAITTDLSAVRLRHYMQKDAGSYRVRKALREQVVFARHNILRDPPFSRLDVIACRNLLIYLERDTQLQVLEIFHFALNKGGLLFLGSAESADTMPELFTVVDKKHRVYRATAARRPSVDLPALNGNAVPKLALELASQAPRKSTSPLSSLHERLLLAHAGPSIVTDSNGIVLHTSTGAGRFLRHVEGLQTQDLVDMADSAIAPTLRAALLHARHTGRDVAAAPLRWDSHAGPRVLQITVRRDPLQTGQGAMLVSFDEFDELVIPGLPIAGQDTAREAVLEEELQNLRDQLNGSIGESTSSSEALRAANEELQSINEELRSTAEELETSKEELQSVNEELTTVNFELKGKVDEVAKVNDDLTNLIASMNIATIFVDRSTRIKRFTPIVGDLFNILATDVGRPLLDLTHRLAYPELRDDLWRVLETLRFVEREIAGEGDSRYLVRISPYRSNDDRIEGAVINFVDVTELHRAQQELRARDERLRLVVESTRDYAIVTLDSTGRVTGFNKGAELIFGYPEKEMLGEHFERLFVPEDRLAGVPESELQQARSEGRAADERWHRRKDGSRFFCSGITTLFADRSGPGFAKIARDLTERQRLERQRQELLDAEKQVRVRLEAAGAMRSEFLAIMSHELKNPLNLILMRVELLARAAHGREVPELQPSLDLIRRTVRAQSRIIDDLLDLSRVTTGKLALHRTPVKGLAVVARIVEAVLPESQSNGVALTLRGEDLTVLADEVRLEQMVWNLLSNALKFTKRGDAITVTLTREGSYAVLTVIDSGRGIEPSALRRIFEMFDQGGGKASTRREGGLGIGLALVKQLAELHDGRIEAHSDGTGFGARFTLSLPLFSTGPGAADAGTLGNGRMNGLRILLVEDDADTLEATRLLLTLEGAQVSATANAHDALAAAEGGVFDLVISDIGMPEMDGFELARRLRANTRSARWPVVAVSGFGSASDVARALEAGFSAHLPKPLAMEELDRAVGELLGTQRDPAAGAA